MNMFDRLQQIKSSFKNTFPEALQFKICGYEYNNEITLTWIGGPAVTDVIPFCNQHHIHLDNAKRLYSFHEIKQFLIAQNAPFTKDEIQGRVLFPHTGYEITGAPEYIKRTKEKERKDNQE